MKKYIISLISIAFLFSCTPQSKINKLKGHSLTFMLNELGKPDKILPGKSDTTYIYEKKKILRSTEINKAVLTLDPMVTPMVHKTDTYSFTIKDGFVVDAKHEIKYDKKAYLQMGVFFIIISIVLFAFSITK